MKLVKKYIGSKYFVKVDSKAESKALLKAAQKSLTLSMMHERSTACLEFDPDFDLRDKYFKKDCYYSLYYRKVANDKTLRTIPIPKTIVVKFKDAVKLSKKEQEKLDKEIEKEKMKKEAVITKKQPKFKKSNKKFEDMEQEDLDKSEVEYRRLETAFKETKAYKEYMKFKEEYHDKVYKVVWDKKIAADLASEKR